VKITHCGMCATDIHTIDSGWGPTNYPVVVGHEIIGHISAVGSAVTDFVVGERVGVGAQAFACLNCDICKQGHDNMCPKRVLTYNDKYSDGSIAHGGYADRIRLSAAYTFKIPAEMPSNVTAPLLCAGTTVYVPLAKYAKPGMHVGIVGIGGLGHLALQFARAMQCTVYAISHSPAKKEDALRFGAHQYVLRSECSSKLGRKLDLLLITSYGEESDWDDLLGCVKIDERAVILGIPDHCISINPMTFMKGVALHGSLIGPRRVVKDMLEFAAKHKIAAQIQEYEMKNVNEAIDHLRAGQARYRIVFHNK